MGLLEGYLRMGGDLPPPENTDVDVPALGAL